MHGFWYSQCLSGWSLRSLAYAGLTGAAQVYSQIGYDGGLQGGDLCMEMRPRILALSIADVLHRTPDKPKSGYFTSVWSKPFGGLSVCRPQFQIKLLSRDVALIDQ
jgi:hypothetical protein